VSCSDRVLIGRGNEGGPAGQREECGNGVDDDGDGRIDDGCPCGNGETQSCFRAEVGRRNLGRCRDGVQQCQSSAEFGDWGAARCDASTEPRSESCSGEASGVDDDCDGAIDEGCPCDGPLTRSCAEQGLAPPCEPGQQTCREGRWSACEGDLAPTAEICGNEVDDDCDGKADERCDCVPTPELCADGIDNDCDGETDEPACRRCGPDIDGCEEVGEGALCGGARYCGSGLLCIEIGWPPGTPSQCLRQCETADDCDIGPCFPTRSYATGVETGVCGSGCLPVSGPGCDAPLFCYLVDIDFEGQNVGWTTLCGLPSDKTEGDSCDGAVEACGPALACAESTCLPVCRVGEADCASGTCREVVNAEGRRAQVEGIRFGACAP
jgi:hypothetical protein